MAPVWAATHPVALGQSLAQVVSKAADGDTIELAAGVHRGQTAVITQRALTVRSAGPERAVLMVQGQAAEDKAIVVVRGGRVHFENLEFRGARVADRNGAGIRFEKGHLTVLRCAFYDNENGILAGNDGDAELVVANSEFGLAPPNTPLPHLIYVGRIKRFELRGSRVSGGQQGHLVKSRARMNDIRYNRLVDGAGGQAAYELEFPEGGQATVVGNVIGQSAASSNATVLAFGAEGDGKDPLTTGPGAGLRQHRLLLVNNTFVNTGLRPAWFVRVHHQKLHGPVHQRWVNNLFVGLGAALPHWADWAQGNYATLPSSLQDPEIGLFELSSDSWLRGKGVGPDDLLDDPEARALLPTAVFMPPAGTLRLTAVPHWSPGAYP